LTPTVLGGQPTFGENSTPVGTPTFVQLVTGNSLTRTSFVDGFVSIMLSATEISWGESGRGESCEQKRAGVIAQVSEPIRIEYVTLFLRLQSKRSGGGTDWHPGILMAKVGGGTFTSGIDADTIPRHEFYPDAWVQMQFVSTDAKGRIIDRTPVFAENLSLTVCP
jgi:hypothetical protein